MIKSFGMIRRKAGLSQEEFLHYWKEVHAPLAARIVPGLRRYIQNHPVKLAGREFEIDGIVEFWFDDVDGFKNYLAWRKTDQGRVLQEDEAKFIDRTGSIVFLAEEHVVLDR